MSQQLPEEWLIADARMNAAIAWLFTAFLAIAALGNALAGEFVTMTGAGVAVLVAIIPAWVGRSWQRTVPWPLLALPVIPFVLSALELTFLADFVRGIAVATLALLIVIVLQMTTTVRMTPGFAVWFSLIATLGTAGIWAFSSWLSAVYFGTDFFETNTELMLFFLVTFVAGLVASGIFVWYFRQRLRENLEVRTTTGGIA